MNWQKEADGSSSRDCFQLNQKKYPLIQSYGRKRSHGLSESQKSDIKELLKHYGITTLPTTFIKPIHFFLNWDVSRRTYVEIGFGAGEHLIKNATQNPTVAFIGCEPFENGVVQALRAIRSNGLKNVRIFNGDARLLLEKFDTETVDKFYILFPDPWPKQRYHKRRLVSENFVRNFLHAKLKQGGEIVIATDCADYMRSIVVIFTKILADHFQVIKNNLGELQARPDWFISTRYERKAIANGLCPFYFVAKKR